MFGDGIEIGRRCARVVEQSHALAIGGDAGMAHVDVDLPRSVAIGRAADQERLDAERERTIAGVPAPVLDEQILVLLEPHQRQCRKTVALDVQPKQDRELVLQPAKFVRHGKTGHHVVAKRRADPGMDAQVAMSGIVENLVLAHAAGTFWDCGVTALRNASR